MGLKETCNRVYDLAVNGRLNGERFSKTRLYDYVKGMFKLNAIENKVYLVIELNDGQWFCKIEQFAPGEYDYYIPETREEEHRLINRMMAEMQAVEVNFES